MKFSFVYAKENVKEDTIEALIPKVQAAHRQLEAGTGKGNEYSGWLHLPERFDNTEVSDIKNTAQKIRNTSQVFIVLGVGGSYLGAKAAIDMLTNSFYNLLAEDRRNAPQIFFAGHSLSGAYLSDLLELVRDKDFSLNVISKSGTTIETAIAFRCFKALLEEKYGKEGAKERIYITTNPSRGALYEMAKTEGYTCFPIPENIGGRYSVLTPVGLLPVAVSGIDIECILRGAQDAMQAYDNDDVLSNDCYMYALIRNALYRQGKTIEILASYEPGLHFFAEWWKQLYGESEGKEGKGIFPAVVDFTTDLHSMGQYIQDGARNLFETVLHVKSTDRDVIIPKTDSSLYQLSYLEGKSVNCVNEKAYLGTLMAHEDGGVPCLIIEMEKMDAYHFGYAVYFFEKACAISGYLQEINPFDQPGVEAYKQNMYALLGKAGHEEAGVKLQTRLDGMNK